MIVRMIHSGEIRNVSGDAAKKLIETKQAVPVTPLSLRYAVATKNRETR